MADQMNVNANVPAVGEEGFAMLGGNEMNMGEGAMESMTTLNPASVDFWQTPQTPQSTQNCSQIPMIIS